MSSLALVTGATQGIGRSIAEALASEDLNRYVILICRDQKRGDEAVKQIRNTTGNENVRCEHCDVSLWKNVTAMRDRISHNFQNMKILVNNAAECPRQQEFVMRPIGADSADTRVDKQFATNVLGYHFMLKAFMASPHFDTTNTLVVNVASNWAGNLDLNDVNFTRRRYDNDTAYRQSKQADRMLNKAWSERVKNATFVSCHPGDPCTTLSCALGYNVHASKDCSGCVERNVMSLARAHGKGELLSGHGMRVGREEIVSLKMR